MFPFSENSEQNLADSPNVDDNNKFSLDGLPYHQQNDQVQYDTETLQNADTNSDKARIYRPQQQPRRKTINPVVHSGSSSRCMRVASHYHICHIHTQETECLDGRVPPAAYETAKPETVSYLPW